MTVQTTYEKNIAKAIPGLIYDMGNTDIDSFAAEVAIPYGIFVSRGASPDQVVVGDAAAIGVSIREPHEGDYPVGAYDGGAYKATETVGVLRSGYIWAQFDAAGGTVDAAATIDANGMVVAAGGGTALTGIKATIEMPAVDATINTTGVFVGLVKIS